MIVFKPKSNTKFVATPSIGEHDHSTVVYKRQQKSDELWQLIWDLKHKDGMKPRKIRDHLLRTRPNDKMLTIRQIRHIIHAISAEKIPSTFTFGELVEWLKSQTKVPKFQDSAFVDQEC